MKERLRLLFHERLAAYLFPGRERDFRALALKHLSVYLKREGDFFLFGPEDLSALEKAFSELKASFSKELGEAPLPFSLLPEKRAGSWVRPGKIYVSPALKEGLEKISKDLEFLTAFYPWQDLLEVVLPATTDPEVFFKTRDLLWVGNKGPCFYCGLPWHANADCPGLKEVVAGKALKAYFYRTLKDLGEGLSQKLLKGELLDQELQGLYGRYFYFQPAFLRVLYYKVPEWSSFSEVRLGKEIPTRGGNLLIALENLHHGDFKESESRFLAAGEPSDYRVGLGLCQLAVLQEDYERALYYLEEVSTGDLPPLIQSVIFLLKARIHEMEKDLISAEQFYAEALKRDHSAVPAAYHKLLVSFYLGGTERHLFRLSPHLGHPLIFYLSFLEPAFLSFGQELEKELLSRIEKKQAEALATLRKAEDGLHRLKQVLSEEELVALEDQLSSLREKIYNGSFMELEEAAHRAMELSLEVEGYTYRKIRELRERISEFFSQYHELKRYWSRYPYKYGEEVFGERLREFGTRLLRLEQRLGKDPTKNFRNLLKEAGHIQELLENLEEEKKRLEAKRVFRKQLSTFIKIFVAGEIFLFLLYFSVPSFLAVTAPELLPSLPFSFSSFLGASFLVFIFALFWVLFRR